MKSFSNKESPKQFGNFKVFCVAPGDDFLGGINSFPAGVARPITKK